VVRAHRGLAALVTVPLALVLLVTSGCGTIGQWVTPQPSAASAPGTGSLTWRACPEIAKEQLRTVPTTITYECASVAVPQDWSTAKDGKPADGKTFSIALLRARSTAQRNRVGSLLIDPGGPGGSGVEFATQLSTELPTEILHRFDIVGFDPRGVGRSNPVRCYSDADLDASFAAEPDPISDAEFDAVVALQARAARTCGAKYGDSLRLFSTEQTARDMDAIRAALGDSKLTYLGYSYGTLLGAVYAQLFPTRIRAMVLDGAIDPLLTTVDSALDQAKGFERAFTNFTTWCRLNPKPCPIGPDARATVTDVLRAARQAPLASRGRTATAGWILTAVVAALYSQDGWPILATAIDDLRRGNATRVLALADLYGERDATGHYNNLIDVLTTVTCNDDATTTISRDKARQLQSDWRTQYPLVGPYLAVSLLSCAQWPAQRDPYPTGKAVGAPPIVVVGTTGDPATPYENTARLAEMLGVGVVLTWQGEGHTAYPHPGCVSDAIDTYLLELTPPPAGTICPPA